MRASYIQVAYRRGKPIAAYLYIPREENERSVRVQSFGDEFKVDFNADDRPIGIEIPDPVHCTPEQVNAILEQLSLPALPSAELAPLATM